MVGSTGITLVCIYTSHKLGSGVFGQLLHDMYCLVVLALGIDNLDGLILIDENTSVTNLSTHLTIKGGSIKYEFIELIFLLCHFAIAQDMTVVFRIVVADELLFSSFQFCPVAILHSSSITGTLFLLLHLDIKLLLVNGEAVLTTNQLCEVEGEAIGVEQTESLNTIEYELLAIGYWLLAFYFCHRLIQQLDTLVKGTQEGIFLFFDNLRNQCLLSFQLWESIAHLMYEGRNEFIEETVFLSEESISIANGSSQDTTDDITCFRIRRQLSISNRERYGTQMVSTDTHGDVDVILALGNWLFAVSLFLEGRIFQACNLLLCLDDGLEDIGIVVRVLALQHTDQTLESHTSIDDVHREFL